MNELGYYDKFIIDEASIDETLFCIICSRLLSSDILQCREGHVACKECFINHLNKKKDCFVCRDEITDVSTLSRNRYLEKEVRKVKIYCPNSFNDQGDTRIENESNRCNEQLVIDSLETHLKNCLFSGRQCGNNEKCGRILNKDYDDHIANICPYQLVECTHCKSNTITRSDLLEHINTLCLAVETTCTFCEQSNIKKGDLAQHLKTICQSIEIECPYASVGCSVLIKRSKIEQHTEHGHMNYAKLVIDQLSARLDLTNSLLKDTTLALKETNSSLNLLKLNFKEIKKSKRYSGKWIIENWSDKLKYPRGSFINLPRFAIDSNFFFSLKLFPTGQFSESLAIHVVKMFNLKSRVSFSFEIENLDPKLSLEEDSTFLFGKFNDYYSVGFYGDKFTDPNNGFIQNNTLTINFSIEVLKIYDDSFYSK